MNFFGVGIMELAIIFLVAFLVMGPLKTIQMARSAGKLIGDLRRTVNDISSAVDLSGLDPTKPDSTATSQPGTQRPPDPPPTGAIPTTGIAEKADDSPGVSSTDGSAESSGDSPGVSDERRS